MGKACPIKKLWNVIQAFPILLTFSFALEQMLVLEKGCRFCQSLGQNLVESTIILTPSLEKPKPIKNRLIFGKTLTFKKLIDKFMGKP